MGGKLAVICILIILIISVAGINVVIMAKPEAEAARVTIYEGPSGVGAAPDVEISVEGRPLFVYSTAVNHNRSWSQNPKLSSTPVAYFDFTGQVEIAVRFKDKKIENAIVKPLSLGIRPKIKGDALTFSISQPANLTIEINNSVEGAIHLFANGQETNIPSPDDPDVIYLGPGVHQAERIPVKSNKTIYIAGGAVVRGVIKADGVKNVKVMGRGIIDGSSYDRWKQTMIPVDFRHSSNISLEGIIFLNPAGWTVNTYFCENVNINNIKIISARSNGDGITAQSCKNLTASGCFVRTWDDSLVVKNYDNGSSKGITFENMIVWTDLAQSCEIGYETDGPLIEDVNFSNITVLHNFHKPVLSIHNSDNALVRNIRYRDIVVEDAQMGEGDGFGNGQLLDLTIQVSQWSSTNSRGSIRDVYFENISVLSGKKPPIRISGFDSEHTVENVFIRNLEILGKKIISADRAIFEINPYTKNIQIE